MNSATGSPPPRRRHELYRYSSIHALVRPNASHEYHWGSDDIGADCICDFVLEDKGMKLIWPEKGKLT